MSLRRPLQRNPKDEACSLRLLSDRTPAYTANVTTAPTHTLSGRDSVKLPDETEFSFTEIGIERNESRNNHLASVIKLPRGCLPISLVVRVFRKDVFLYNMSPVVITDDPAGAEAFLFVDNFRGFVKLLVGT